MPRFRRPRRVISCALNEYMHTDLVQAALVMTVCPRTNLVRSVGRAAVPELGLTGGVMFEAGEVSLTRAAV